MSQNLHNLGGCVLCLPRPGQHTPHHRNLAKQKSLASEGPAYHSKWIVCHVEDKLRVPAFVPKVSGCTAFLLVLSPVSNKSTIIVHGFQFNPI